MSSPVPVEQQLLQACHATLESMCAGLPISERAEARMQILEATACRIGNLATDDYFKAFRITRLLSGAVLQGNSKQLAAALGDVPIPSSLALSALSREYLSDAEQRATGAFYTDFRLAALLADSVTQLGAPERPVIDPACGSGILLCALSLRAAGKDAKARANWLSKMVIAGDRSAAALRGATLALASLTDDLSAVVSMRGNWYLGDSLMAGHDEWARRAPDGFGAVVANPPWEKLKVMRPEFAKARGSGDHYGASHADRHLNGLEKARQEVAQYARQVAERYPLATTGELDLYAAFTELFLRLARNGGVVAALVPAGLIRSQSTSGLRQKVLSSLESVRIAVIDNRSRFFQIDTRFKFLALVGRTRLANSTPSRDTALVMSHISGTATGCEVIGEARIPFKTLRDLRPDLSLPEVRSSGEWRLFAKAAGHGIQWDADSGPWAPNFCREVDMTKERACFAGNAGSGGLPVVEGRMVQQHRFGCKVYSSGTGRRALWEPLPLGESRISPQFFIPEKAISEAVRIRVTQERVGFCDIAGQTNERSMMAALIPAGVVCGNKVPTVRFAGPDATERMLLWIGMVNSFSFDWLLRRVLTTTVNYFLLRSVPLPRLDPKDLPACQVIAAVKQLRALDEGGYSVTAAWKAARLRARIDVICARAYGLEFEDVCLVLDDFPSLDRGQPALPGEAKSTITRDFVLLSAALAMKVESEALAARVRAAKLAGAIPFFPSQHALVDDSEGVVNGLSG
jgi:hypothetical protein